MSDWDFSDGDDVGVVSVFPSRSFLSSIWKERRTLPALSSFSLTSLSGVYMTDQAFFVSVRIHVAKAGGGVCVYVHLGAEWLPYMHPYVAS